MQSRATTVTEYMREVPPERMDALTELREVCLQTLQGYKEGMEYGMPYYTREGYRHIAWNSQKGYISLYLPSEILKKYKPQLKHLDLGGGCIRFKKPEQLNFTLIKKMLEDAALVHFPQP